MHALLSATGALYDTSSLGRLRSFLEQHDDCDCLGQVLAFVVRQEANCGRHESRGVSRSSCQAGCYCSTHIEQQPPICDCLRGLHLLLGLRFQPYRLPALFYVTARLFRQPGIRRTEVVLDMRGAWFTNALHMSAGVHGSSGTLHTTTSNGCTTNLDMAMNGLTGRNGS